jgi:hypothetical protein
MKFLAYAASLALATWLAIGPCTAHAADTQAQRSTGGTPGGASTRSDADRPRGGPPPEALAACSTLKPGQDCSFRGRERDLKGTCWAPQGKPLACRPGNGAGGSREAPANATR